MKEAVFQSEVVKSLQTAGAWAWKITDHPVSMIQGSFRYTPEKPFDIVAMHDGRGIGIECKQMRKYQGLKLEDFRQSQIDNLTEIAKKEAGGAYAFINIRITMKKGSPGINRLVIFPWHLLLDRFEKAGPLQAEFFRQAKGIDGKKGLFELSKWLDIR